MKRFSIFSFPKFTNSHLQYTQNRFSLVKLLKKATNLFFYPILPFKADCPHQSLQKENLSFGRKSIRKLENYLKDSKLYINNSALFFGFCFSTKKPSNHTTHHSKENKEPNTHEYNSQSLQFLKTKARHNLQSILSFN